MTVRTLADRLAELRTEQPRHGRRPIGMASDRTEAVARWLGARLELGEGGGTLVLERSIPIPPDEMDALRCLDGAVYFDTETTGLSTGVGTVPFLAGLGIVADGKLRVRQLLLPDYPHERALLRLLAAELAAKPRVVTYNGRSFDLPLLVTRLTLHGLFVEQASLPSRHDDLLPTARRFWRRPLGSARLADIETAVLDVHRTSDCPSAEVPARYLGYLHTGSPEPLVAVLDHNLQDIVSLARLEARIRLLRSGAWRDAPILDHRGLALDLIRDGEPDQAAAVLDRAIQHAGPGREGHLIRLLASRALMGSGQLDAAEAMWAAATRRASAEAALAWLEIARVRERARDDLRAALEAAASAARVLDLAFALGRGGTIAEIAAVRIRVDRRRRRLERWVAARERRSGVRSTAPSARGRDAVGGVAVGASTPASADRAA